MIEFGPSLSVPAVFVLTTARPNEDGALIGDLDLIGTLAINGAGSQNTIVDGNASNRVFEVRPGARVTITGLYINDRTLQPSNRIDFRHGDRRLLMSRRL